MYDFENLTRYNIPLIRSTQCACRPNNYGHKLLNLCKKLNIYIANSRVGDDKGVGYKTCKDISVVDYLLLSSKLFPLVETFRIEDFVPLYSDCHCMIKFSFRSVVTNTRETVADDNSQSFVKWCAEKKSDYANRIRSDPDGILEQTFNDLDEFSMRENITQSEMDNIVLKISQNFTNAANETFGATRNRKPYNKHDDSKPWFNRKCSVKRKLFHKARKRYSFIKNAENRCQMRQASKDYKTTLNKAYTDYQFKAENELRKISKTDPKKLWKILNSLSGNKKRDNDDDITLEALYDHFKGLNENNIVDDDHIDFNLNNNNITEECDVFLNGPITESEIRKAVSSLKNGKASGSDKILNEYIKSTLEDLLPIYCKLFNLILDTEIIPESWSSGILIAIFKNKGSNNDPDMYRGITLNSCFSKTFSSILNIRLNNYADHAELISKSQAGFRRGFATIDNIFVLFALISIYFSIGKKLFCVFVDFKSAFDTVWRIGLWQKLQKFNIRGKIFTVIYNMYQNIKSCVKKGKDYSDFLAHLTKLGGLCDTPSVGVAVRLSRRLKSIPAY